MHLHSLPLLRIWLSISVPVQGAESSAIAKSGPSENSTTSTQSTPAEFILHHAIASKLASGPASGVRKMRADEGEKFFFEDWYFGDERADSSGLSERGLSHQNWNESSNLSTELEADAEDGDEDGDQYNRTPARFIAQSFPFESSFPPFSGSNLNLDPASEARSRLEARNFECPTGTSACTSIGRSDRCCGSGETCEIVADTGYGTVGCCPSSKECSGAIGSCPSGYSACASALGGGCCIPGYDCVAGGCEYNPFVLSFYTYTFQKDAISLDERC